MDLNYIENVIIPRREKEIEEGKNEATADPIYVVLNLEYNFISGHDEDEWLSGDIFNYKEKPCEFGYVDSYLESEDREFEKDAWGMSTPEKVTKIYTDRIVAFFLTSKGAEDYLQYQAHNLSDPYIYIFNAGYRNDEMNNVLRQTK